MRSSIQRFTGACAAIAVVALAGCTDTVPVTAPGDSELIRALPLPAPPTSSHDYIYEVKIENLTTSQPLSPPVIATHDETVTVFQIGAPASEGIRIVAEEGRTGPLVEELEAQAGVYEIVVSDGPLHIATGTAPGPVSRTAYIRADENARYVSIATMLVCTNDGFTGGNALPLPQGEQPVVFHAAGYDAGTEVNNELSPYLADTCGRIGPPVGGRLPEDGNDRVPEQDVIRAHPGIHGLADLVLSRHSWRGPIARITVRRVPAVTYEVTIENLTTGQPLSPPVLATHGETATFFEVGEEASEGIRIIAEEGRTGPAVDELSKMAGTFDITVGDGPIHRIGGPGSSSMTLQIRAGGDAHYLSLATMLVCTNDGFTGGNALRLPEAGQTVVHLANGYDAGTEVNNELSPYLADTCGAIGPIPLPMDGNDRIPEQDVIRLHPGIQGGGDLVPALHGWTDPVARITVRRAP
jgi:hypothetical protein